MKKGLGPSTDRPTTLTPGPGRTKTHRLFGECSDVLMKKLENVAESKEAVDMETLFCSVSLDIIGKAVFNYPFDSVTQESPIIKVRTYAHIYLRHTHPLMCFFYIFWYGHPTHSHTLHSNLHTYDTNRRRCTACWWRRSTAPRRRCPTGTCRSRTSSSRASASSM